MLCFVLQAEQAENCAKATEQPSEQKQYPFGDAPQAFCCAVLVDAVQQKCHKADGQVGNTKNFDDKFLML